MAGLFPARDRAAALAYQGIDDVNPFLPERVELERELLGAGYTEVGAARAMLPDSPAVSPNHEPLRERAEEILKRAHERLAAAPDASFPEDDLVLYEDLVIYLLYHRRVSELLELARTGTGGARVDLFDAFEKEALQLLRPGGRRLPHDYDPVHLFALLFQVGRSFQRIYENILGSSAAAVRLRAEVWQSIFTRDIRRYQRSLYRRMVDVPTLVTGPSGTGKELVARAVGLSMYLPFDAKKRTFPDEEGSRFLALNLSALSPTLIESELFGHKRGAFTGALDAREGWFELCPSWGTVFLDEIGELDPEIQVKLLRVLQTRSFQRLGDTATRTFQGKVVSATNRDLTRSIEDHRFREDLYYRICSDRIETPSLADQIAGSLDELERLAVFIARNLVDDEAEALAKEVAEWVDANLGASYAWPGNFRELEQCVRSVLIRGEYRPRPGAPRSEREKLAEHFLGAQATAEEVLRDYCTLVYEEVGTYDGAARRLGLDRRTVRAKVRGREAD